MISHLYHSFEGRLVLVDCSLKALFELGQIIHSLEVDLAVLEGCLLGLLVDLDDGNLELVFVHLLGNAPHFRISCDRAVVQSATDVVLENEFSRESLGRAKLGALDADATVAAVLLLLGVLRV